MARGPVRSAPCNSRSASAAVPTIQRPAAFRSLSERARLVTCANGTVSAAPAATLRTAGVRPTARSRGATTARTPAASAVRRQAPRLCGSVTPSSTRTQCRRRRCDQQIEQAIFIQGGAGTSFRDHALVGRATAKSIEIRARRHCNRQAPFPGEPAAVPAAVRHRDPARYVRRITSAGRRINNARTGCKP